MLSEATEAVSCFGLTANTIFNYKSWSILPAPQASAPRGGRHPHWAQSAGRAAALPCHSSLMSGDVRAAPKTAAGTGVRGELSAPFCTRWLAHMTRPRSDTGQAGRQGRQANRQASELPKKQVSKQESQNATKPPQKQGNPVLWLQTKVRTTAQAKASLHKSKQKCHLLSAAIMTTSNNRASQALALLPLHGSPRRGIRRLSLQQRLCAPKEARRAQCPRHGTATPPGETRGGPGLAAKACSAPGVWL